MRSDVSNVSKAEHGSRGEILVCWSSNKSTTYARPGKNPDRASSFFFFLISMRWYKTWSCPRPGETAKGTERDEKLVLRWHSTKPDIFRMQEIKLFILGLDVVSFFGAWGKKKKKRAFSFPDTAISLPKPAKVKKNSVLTAVVFCLCGSPQVIPSFASKEKGGVG